VLASLDDHVGLSLSYAVLVGLEAYVKTRKKIKDGVHHMVHGKDKVLHPEEVKKQKEMEQDHSESAEGERRVLALEKEQKHPTRRTSFQDRFKNKLHLHHDELPEPMTTDETLRNSNARPQKDSMDVEAAIPPDGKR